MNRILKYLFFAAALFSVSDLKLSAQVRTDGDAVVIDGQVRIDKTVCDFGDVMLDQGPLTATFNVENISSAPLVIYNVVSSCGCTGVKWTREPLQKGKTGSIVATYSNDEGPYPFDKTLTVYFSSVKKPVVLRLRGVAHEKKRPLSELFPVRRGVLGLKKDEIKLGNLSQGSQRSDAVEIANLGKSPLKISFADVTPGLKISVSPNPIPAQATARMSYIVTADRSLWGKNYYYASPVVNGQKLAPIKIWAFTKEDFSGWSKEMKDNASHPVLDSSTFDFGSVKKGTSLRAKFEVKNIGKSPFVVYKADPDSDAVQSPKEFPKVPSGGVSDLYFDVSTSDLPAGDVSIVVILTTNSPLRPIINLYISGNII